MRKREIVREIGRKLEKEGDCQGDRKETLERGRLSGR